MNAPRLGQWDADSAWYYPEKVSYVGETGPLERWLRLISKRLVNIEAKLDRLETRDTDSTAERHP